MQTPRLLCGLVLFDRRRREWKPLSIYLICIHLSLIGSFHDAANPYLATEWRALLLQDHVMHREGVFSSGTICTALQMQIAGRDGPPFCELRSKRVEGGEICGWSLSVIKPQLRHTASSGAGMLGCSFPLKYNKHSDRMIFHYTLKYLQKVPKNAASIPKALPLSSSLLTI